MAKNTNWSSGSRATLANAICAKATIAFPLKIADKVRWGKLRKQLLVDTPAGWRARRAAPYRDGSGALTFSCLDPNLFGNVTPEWIERMAAKLQLVTER